MTEKITLRAKSDGTEFTAVLAGESDLCWYVRHAPETRDNRYHKREWDRVCTRPTAPGAVFRATVRGVENVRVMYAPTRDDDAYPYFTPSFVFDCAWHGGEHIDPSTVVPELEGIDE